MDFKRSALEVAGFTGFESIQELGHSTLKDVPQQAGVYVVLRELDGNPLFLDVNPGGWFNGDPTVSKEELAMRWVSGAHVIYVGKGGGAKGLYQRMRQFIRFGQGHMIGHLGGRYVWQEIMKTTDEHQSQPQHPSDDDLLPEYSFDYSKARPNRFAAKLEPGSRIITLDPDVAEVFTTPEVVNRVLRALIATMPHSQPQHTQQ